MNVRKVEFRLEDCRAAHQRLYRVERHDGNTWIPHGQLAVLRDAVTHDGIHILNIAYHGANHALILRGKVGDPTFQARLNLTESGEAFVGTMSTGGGAPQAIRGTVLQVVYKTERRPQDDPLAPFVGWDDFTIRSEWVDDELQITYLLGSANISDRVRVTKVDRPKGETFLEMPPDFLKPPFQENSFSIMLVSGNRTFTGTYTDDDQNVFDWRGSLAPAILEDQAAVFQAAHASRPSALELAEAAGPATMSLQDLDNISSIQVLISPDGKETIVDWAQTTTGEFFNKCLANSLDQEWIDGIYGHAFALPDGVNRIRDSQSAFFVDNAVLGTGQMLYDNLSTNPLYAELLKGVRPDAMRDAWVNMGKSTTAGLTYQDVSSQLYIQGYRDGVPLMQPYLEDDPEQWAKDYFDWLSDEANLLTWQIQVASRLFENVKTRMYEWYVKLQVLAPDKDYGEQFMTIAYAALLGVNYSRSLWSEDIQPFLEATLENAMSGKVDPAVMDQVQQQAAEENQKLVRSLITTQDEIISLADGIAAGIAIYQERKQRQERLQVIAADTEAQELIGAQLPARQQQAWGDLTRAGKIGGVLSMVFYGATAGFLIFTIADNAQKPLTPRQIIEEVNMGILALALLVKGVQKMMSVGVGRFLEGVSQAGEGGAFRTFAGEISTWFKEGGRIIPEGKAGKAFVAIFGESATDFMARRIAPAMALAGVVLSAFMLYESIESGRVRDIVFEALNTFFALADLVFIGLQLASVAWAGPVGLAVAAVGVIVILVQLIWGLIDPPPPPPDPITEFVDGPMVAKGFAFPG